MAPEISSERRAFTFEWRIEEFGRCEHVTPSYVLESPRFNSRLLDGSVFKLRLYPRGVNERDSNLSLAISTLIRFCPRTDVNCEWCCLGKGGTPLAIRSVESLRLEAESCFHLPRGPMQMEVFEVERDDYIHQGALTVRCRIWDSDGNAEDDEYIHARSVVEIREDSFTWPIKDFSTLQLNQLVTSPIEGNFFPHMRQPLILNFSLKGKTLEESSASFEVILRTLAQPLWFCFCVSFFNADGRLIDTVRVGKSFKASPIPQTWNIESLMTRQSLLQRMGDRGDVLKLLFTGKFHNCSGIISASRYGNVCIETGSMDSPLAIGESVQHAMQYDQLDGFRPQTDSVSTLLYDIQTLFEDHPMSDVQLRSGEFGYPVHKNVLSVRSPVFKTLFADEEKVQVFANSLDVQDIDHRTLRTFLTYLYTGVVANLHFRDALELYHAADKYHVPSLKRECAAVLRSEMGLSNVFDVVDVAERRQDMELIACVSDFIALHHDQVVLSDEWVAFQANESYFAVKIKEEIQQKKLKHESQ